MGAIGAASLGGGVAAVFISENGVGTGVLIAFGGALVVLALLGDRIETLEFGGTTVRLRAAAERYALADELERQGRTADATRLRAEASALLDAATPLAARYDSLRSSMPPGPSRTRAMEEVVDQARRLASAGSFDVEAVSHWLRGGSEQERITALAMMQAKPELRDFEGAISAITDSRSAFEQFHALLLAAKMIDGLGPADRQRLEDAVREVRGVRFRHDSDRWRLSEEILQSLAS